MQVRGGCSPKGWSARVPALLWACDPRYVHPLAGMLQLQGKRLWKAVEEEMEPVLVLGRRHSSCPLTESAFSPSPLQRNFSSWAATIPYLDQRDRLILQPDKSLHRKILAVANPGAIIYRGDRRHLEQPPRKEGAWTSRPLCGIRVRRQDILAPRRRICRFPAARLGRH